LTQKYQMDPINNWSKTTRSLSRMSQRADNKRRANSRWWEKTAWQNPDHRACDTEQEQLVGYWAASKGVTRQDIQNPDIALLLRIREDIFDMLDRSQQARWGAYWGQVFGQRRKLSKKKLQHLETDILKAQARHKIKQTRQNPKKETDDMTVKQSPLDQTPPWD